MTNTNKERKLNRKTRRSTFGVLAGAAIATASLVVPAGAALACGNVPTAQAQPQVYTDVQAAPMPQNASQRDVELYESLSRPSASRHDEQARRDGLAVDVMSGWYRSQDKMTDVWVRPEEKDPYRR